MKQPVMSHPCDKDARKAPHAMTPELRISLAYTITEQDIDSATGERTIKAISLRHGLPEVFLNGASMGTGHDGILACVQLMTGQRVEHVHYETASSQ
jgi:hypothetical protein